MSADYNSTVVCGPLLWNPGLERLSDGTEVSVGTIVTSQGFVGQDGQKKEHVAFVPAFALARRALAFSALRQGQAVFAIGHLRTQAWQEEGGAQARLVLVCHVLRPLLEPVDGAAKVPAQPGDDETPSPPPS